MIGVTEQMLYAGGGLKLSTSNKDNWDAKSAGNTTLHFARENVRRTLYGIVNSLAMNGLIEGVTIGDGFPYYGFALIGYWAVTLVVSGLLVFLMVRRLIKRKPVGGQTAS